MESEQSQVMMPPVPKARCAKQVKPNIPTKPTFLKNQQINKANSKKMMLITNKDGNISVITNTHSPPTAPKPKSTFHLRVQQHGKKFQVCPVGHYVKLLESTSSETSSKDFEVCKLKNDLTWSTLQKNAKKKRELQESCQIDLSEKVVNPLAVMPIPSPRKWNVNIEKSNTEERKSFESIRANFEHAQWQAKPVPNPRHKVNVKLQRKLFEKILNEKEEKQKLTDNPIIELDASNPVLRKIPKNTQKKNMLSSKTLPRRLASRQSKSKLNSKPRPRSMSPDLTGKSSVKLLHAEVVTGTNPKNIKTEIIKSELAASQSSTDKLSESDIKTVASKPIPKPSPRKKITAQNSSPQLAPKPLPRNIPLETVSTPLPNTIPTESPNDIPKVQSSEPIPLIKMKDIPLEDPNLSDSKEHIADGAKFDIPTILISEDSGVKNGKTIDEVVSPVEIHCEHLANLIIESGEDDKENIIEETSDVQSETVDASQSMYINTASDKFMDTILNPDTVVNLDTTQQSASLEEPDSDGEDYVNCNDNDYVNLVDQDNYINGNFFDVTATPSGVYMDFDENSCQSDENKLEMVADDSSSDVSNKQDSVGSDQEVESEQEDDNSGNRNSKGHSECYEVILDVSSLKSPSKKYRRFSCRQPGRRRKSNFKKQSHLNIINDNDGSDYITSQEDVTELCNNDFFEQVQAKEEFSGYPKDEFEDEEDEGWQSVDSSDLDHEEEHNRKHTFHHVLSITPEPAESGVSSGHPSPSRLSATSDSQVIRYNSCVSFISSDGFEDGSVRSSISQFSLSDELDGINTCDSFEEDDFTDNELFEIMKRESGLSDDVPELDMEALKNDTMIHINKMRQKLAEMKRNVAYKNWSCVSLVSNDGYNLSQMSKTEQITNDGNKQNVDSDKETKNSSKPEIVKENTVKPKLKEISWKPVSCDVSSKRNNLKKLQHRNVSIKSDTERNADLQEEESVESAIYISADFDDDETEATKARRLSMGSYVDPDELKSTPRHQGLQRMDNNIRTSWRPGIDGAPPVPPRTPSLKLEQKLSNPSVHKAHISGPVIQTHSKKSKKDFQSRRQSRFVRKEPLFQAYNKDAKLRDTLHYTGNRRQLSTDRDSPPPLPPPRRQSSTCAAKTSPHLMTPERRSASVPEIDLENVNRKPSLKMQRTLWCELPEVIESGILDRIDERERKLQEAMFEVITSEASYLRSLDIFVNNFCKADVLNVSYGLIRKEERHHLFSNLLAVRDASERLLLDLEDRFQENFMISDVCDIIIKHATQRNFDMYVTYCLNNQYQIKTLKALKENPIFVTELGILERSKECGGNNLPSFIMMPFQRITRLPLLIEAIITRLQPDSDKIGTATEALNLVKKVAMKCNEEARRMEGIEELTKLAHKLDYKPNIKAIKISDKLLIVKRGDLQWFSHDTSRFNKKKVVSKLIHILVFADKVVLTKRKIKNDREVFEVFDWCPRNLVDVKSVELKYDTLPEEYKNVMMVVFLQNHEKKEKKYFINTTSDANFQRWSDALAPPNRSDQGESIYESWDCPQVMCTQAYNAQEPDELSMEESDVVDVLRKTEGWWEGMRVRDSAKGWFPASHVQEIVNDHVRARNLKHRYKVLSVCQEQLEKLQMQTKDLRRTSGNQ